MLLVKSYIKMHKLFRKYKSLSEQYTKIQKYEQMTRSFIV